MIGRRVLVAGLLLVTANGFGEVADSTESGFTVKVMTHVQAPPEEVYRKLVRNVGDWWDGRHTFTNDAHNLTIEDKPMGCFCEKIPTGGGARHMEVLFAMPGKRLVLSGALGPMQAQALTGSMDWSLSAADNGTSINVTYAVGGYVPKGLLAWAMPVDKVLSAQVQRLKNYVERGDPASEAK